MAHYFPKTGVKLVPDMVFMLDRHRYAQKHHKNEYDVVLLLRTDKERTLRSNSSVICQAMMKQGLSCRSHTWMNPLVAHCPKYKTIRQYLHCTASQAFGVLSKGRIVVTDRLHGALVSYLGNRGVVYIESVSNKTIGVFKTAFSGREDLCIHSDNSIVQSSHELGEIVTKTLNVFNHMYRT